MRGVVEVGIGNAECGRLKEGSWEDEKMRVTWQWLPVEQG
jgi:hypothetical protein